MCEDSNNKVQKNFNEDRGTHLANRRLFAEFQQQPNNSPSSFLNDVTGHLGKSPVYRKANIKD